MTVPTGSAAPSDAVLTYEFFAPCAKGAEVILADELKSLRVHRIRPLTSGVSFNGPLYDGYKALLWSRTASRVLLVLDRVDSEDADALYEGVFDIAWEDHIDPTRTIAVAARGGNEQLRNTQFLGVKVKDAICDRLRLKTGSRPDVDTLAPDVLINVALRATKATISLDLAGDPLFRRGYRRPGEQADAPLKETLAATVLLAGGWRTIAEAGGVFVDPLCGSGTLAIEAALIAGDVAPGIFRTRWGFEGWLGHDVALWDGLLDEADARAETGRAALGPLFAADFDPRAIQMAIENSKRAGLAGRIAFAMKDIATFELPVALRGHHGLLATNPPYGERLSTASQLPALYAALGAFIQRSCPEFDLSVITPDRMLDSMLGRTPHTVLDTFNGPLETTIRLFSHHVPTGDTGKGAISESAVGSRAVPESLPTKFNEKGTEQFVARLRKMAIHRGRWARKNLVTCYRVYDADLPDYAVAIDIYEGAREDSGKRWIHVAEYAPPKTVDPDLAARRLADILAVAPVILGVTANEVFLKVRRHSKGGAQYADGAGGKKAIHTVSENGLLLEVELASYLDTGLFLDHRTTRSMLREMAAGKDTLNLFAYTGAASVALAAGGARSVTTVDLSQTYLAWAQRNMKLNHFRGDAYTYIRDDAVRWVQEHRHLPLRFDLIFVDPPTFSNSSKMGKRDWDVQRDHGELLIGISRLLKTGGIVVFSCNLRTFKPDNELLTKAGVRLTDITTKTIPADFERNKKIHHCYLVERI